MTETMTPLLKWRRLVASKEGPPSPVTRHVLLTLSLYMSSTGKSCFPSIMMLVGDTGYAKSAVIKHLHIAEADGWIEISKRGLEGQKWARNEYRAIIPKAVHEENHVRGEKAVHEENHVEGKGGPPDDERRSSSREKAVLQEDPKGSYKSSEKSSSARTRVREDDDDEINFLTEDDRATYGPDIERILSEFTAQSADLAYRHILPRRHQGSMTPTSWVVERIEEHGWPKVCAALVITAAQADKPSQKYADQVLKTLSIPESERSPPSGRRRSPGDHYQLDDPASFDNFN